MRPLYDRTNHEQRQDAEPLQAQETNLLMKTIDAVAPYVAQVTRYAGTTPGTTTGSMRTLRGSRLGAGQGAR
jgi:hypothetical protein